MLHKIKHQLKIPFPFSRGVKDDFFSSLRVVIVVTFILYIIKPFGLAKSPESIFIGFGLVAFFTALVNLSINHILIDKAVNHEKWNVWKEIIRNLIFLLIFTATLIIYAHWILRIDLTVGIVIQFLTYTVLIGLIPISTRVVMLQNHLLKKELFAAKRLNSNLFNERSGATDLVPILIKSNIVNETFDTHNQALAFVEANQNYVKIGVLKKNETHEHLFRISLVNVLEQVPDHCLIQCHRSYAFNPNMIVKVTGNSQGLKLFIKGTDKIIPVSRSYKTTVESQLDARHK